ncbi:hypothetical protein GIB67_032683 [Kingdonia uniflora]|uniref:Apple domain-containing protein n=1 Tax=Kingdonia uniflora TaxID=39325 RepID=A0A7J7MW20_9MAGN|nr:hypothetical protein GIB67_032683 [Kingdonia uniflora]
MPKSPQDWDQLDWSAGCIRRIPLDCNHGDGFLKFSALKLPDSSGSWVNKNMNLKECKEWCLKNCSCTAYTNSDIRGRGSGCVIWYGELVDIREFTADGHFLYVRMAVSELEVKGDSSKKKRLVVVTLSVSVVLVILVSILIIWCTIWKPRKTKRGIIPEMLTIMYLSLMIGGGIVTEESKKFNGDGLEMKHLEEITEREVHCVIDLVGGKDGDMSKRFRSKSNEEVATLMREEIGVGDAGMPQGQGTRSMGMSPHGAGMESTRQGAGQRTGQQVAHMKAGAGHALDWHEHATLTIYAHDGNITRE